MFSRMGGAAAGFCGRGTIRGKARGPAVRAQRGLPGPGKTKVTSAGGSRLSPRSGRLARPGGAEGAPAGRTGAGVNRPTVRPRNAAPAGDCNREGGRGNNGAAAVHKAGEERRFGATPATATPLPFSWKPRDPVRKFIFSRMGGASAGFAVAEPSVEKPKDRQSERSEVCRDRAKQRWLQPEGRACRREAVARRGPEA